MKRLIFITEMHQIEKLIRLAEKDDTVVSLRREISDVLKKNGKTSEEPEGSSMHRMTPKSHSNEIKFKSLNDYPPPSEEDAINWMKEWPRRRLNGKTFIESFIHNKLSVWWLMENWLYYSSVYFDPLRDVMLSLQTIETILKTERPEEIIFADDGKINSEILKLFTEYNRKIIPMKLFKFVYAIKRRSKVFVIGAFIDFGFNIRKLLWKLVKPFRKDRTGDVLLISTYEWGLAKTGSGKYIQFDPFIDPIISNLKSTAVTVNIPVGKLLGLKQTINNCLVPNYKILENYDTADSKKRYKKAIKSILNGWRTIKNEKGFTASFLYRGKNMWHLAGKQFSAYFSSRIKGHIRDAELLNSMIEKERPKIIVYPAETSEFGKGLFHLCNLHKIPSVGIQHGVFDKYLACIHKKGESRIGAASPENCPIPTKTFVYGPKYRKILLKGNYPKTSVIVTGAQRFDRIILGRDKFDKRLFCKNFGINPEKKIVAFVTSPLPAGDTEVMAASVMKAAKQAGAQLVIKLHPSETFDVYRKVSDRMKSDAIIVRDIDLYELLDACDLMITHLSTAAIESMVFDKPVILLNLTGRPDRVDYAKGGAAFGVYRKRDLLPMIKSLLSNKRFYAKRRETIRRFVFENAFLTDGEASKRMADAIERMIEGK